MTEPSSPRWQRGSIQTAAYVVVIVAGTWWLLDQWAGVLRPLLLAIFLAYVLLPWHSKLRRAGVPAPLVILGLGGIVAVVMLTVMQIAYSSALDLQGELPSLQARVRELGANTQSLAREKAPWLPQPHALNLGDLGDRLSTFASRAVQSTANGLIEAATTALYLLFILLGAEKLPSRIRHAYPGPKGDRILKIAGGINSAIISYLRAKVISSLLLAAGAGIVLAAFGVKFVAVWMLLTFLCNFIPYVGSVVAYTIPTAYAALQLPPWEAPVAVAVLMLAVQVLSATVFEPMLIGRAVGLSPLLILAALAVWGSIWGLPGMFLAVPLTVVLKIIFENIEATKALARLTDE
jgi:AI-2 transport protein TqsA